MRKISLFLLMLTLSIGHLASAAEEAPAPSGGPGVSLALLLEHAAQRLNKNFIVDPRVRGEAIMFGIDPDKISYRELQAVLSIHGAVATQEMNGVIEIVPDANARQLPMPLVTDRKADVGDDEFVTRVLDVAPLDATQLVPILRPLLPQYAHMVGTSQTNTLIIVDRYANVRRIEAIVRDLQKRPVAPTKPPAN